MASRVRSEVVTYFDVCCEINGDDLNGTLPVKVLYPSDFTDESVLQSIKQFCFPTGNEKSDGDAVQLFTFVLTDAQSQYTFGYCRRTPVTNTCLCILSGLTWTNHFYKFLNHLSNVMINGTSHDVESLLTNAYHIEIPTEGGSMTLNVCTEIGKFNDEIPNSRILPTLRTDKFMLEFYNAVSEKQMVALYASILKERRIMFVGRKLSQLSSCVFALSRLIFPFYWQNLFIPILPQELTDMIMAPMPYLIGVPKPTFGRLNLADAGEVVVVDLDDKTFESPHTDTIPSDALNFLRNQLKSSSEMFLSDGLARSFLQTNALIFGKYAVGFVEKDDEANAYTWDKQTFLNNQRPSIQSFLSSIISKDGVQYFERFIEERLDAVNKGIPIDDEFEKELKSSDLRRFIEKQTNAVRENASEVIVALKGRVQSISIKDKFGRFTTKEVRRSKLRSSKPAKKKGLDPLSIDASQYHFNNPLATLHGNAATTVTTINDDCERISYAESVSSTGDLIDLFDDKNGAPPVAEHSTLFYANSSPSSSASANGGVVDSSGGFSSSGSQSMLSAERNGAASTGTSVPTRLELIFGSLTPNKSFMPSNASFGDSGVSDNQRPAVTISANDSDCEFWSSTNSKTSSVVQRKNWETFE